MVCENFGKKLRQLQKGDGSGTASGGSVQSSLPSQTLCVCAISNNSFLLNSVALSSVNNFRKKADVSTSKEHSHWWQHHFPCLGGLD